MFSMFDFAYFWYSCGLFGRFVEIGVYADDEIVEKFIVDGGIWLELGFGFVKTIKDETVFFLVLNLALNSFASSGAFVSLLWTVVVDLWHFLLYQKKNIWSRTPVYDNQVAHLILSLIDLSITTVDFAVTRKTSLHKPHYQIMKNSIAC